ncbi:MAG: hypothetical protein HC851_06050 [Acaryochloris sp. RU_4_1]|nr:hypothetical protein [Acaryochloris sp. RU_4_1]NJR55514.1 hypothetical protein [Acaryochloris sp. CRU_2_0]
MISHDLDFLSRINVTRSLRLQSQSLQQTIYLPSQRLDYYNELSDLMH